MTDLLSQDEIDALLHGVDDVEEEDVLESENENAVNFDFHLKTESFVVECRPLNLSLI